MVQIDGILWTTKRKKLIDPDSVTHECLEVEMQKGNHQDNSEKDSKLIEPKVAIDVLGCMTLPNTLGSLFGYICFFWLSREVVTNSVVDRYSGVTGMFYTNLSHRQTSIPFATLPSTVARKQIVPQLTRMCQEIWHGQGELWKQG
jgi:hypothetical protein